MARKGQPLLLSRLETKQQLIKEHADLLPKMAPEEWRRVRGEQEVIVRYEPERALAALPGLLRKPGDREKLATLARHLLSDERFEPTTEQLGMAESIGGVLRSGRRKPGAVAPASKRKAAAKRRTHKTR
jgi:hypothetical protein